MQKNSSPNRWLNCNKSIGFIMLRNEVKILLAVLLIVLSGTIVKAQPLCGTYAIGATQPVGFQNLTQALVKLNSQGVSCQVTFELQANYSSAGETFPLVINAFATFNP